VSLNPSEDLGAPPTGVWPNTYDEPPVPQTVPGRQDWREWRIPALLFVLTFLSTTFAGLFYVLPSEVSFFRLLVGILWHPQLLLLGLPFSFTLITILLAHEMGHFLACRHYGIRCTPPFFLPFPVSYAGTLGAFIRIRSHFQHRRALFDVGIAGPLAGFVFAVPALFVGIAFSQLIPKGKIQGHGLIEFGEPLIFKLVGKWVLGYESARQDMFAHPIAMAAWFGLLATSLNLFPIWQLDGGHITYAMLGRERQKRISIAAALALMLISFMGWPIPSYLVFASLILFFGMRHKFYHPPTLDDEIELGPGRTALGIVAFLILILCFTPVPISLS
jgi:membrane-associated protease RseP (regulator of RpoE activity)